MLATCPSQLATRYDLSEYDVKICSLSYFEHSSNWYFSMHSLSRYIIIDDRNNLLFPKNQGATKYGGLMALIFYCSMFCTFGLERVSFSI